MTKILGPPSYENWTVSQSGKQADDAYECPLFTDADINGEALEGYGPYQFLNAGHIYGPSGGIRSAIFLRVEWYRQLSTMHDFSPMDKTDLGYYHGGDANDEIAALMSLALGARIKAGGITREFKRGRDPRGWPCSWDFHYDPVFTKSTSGEVVPSATGKRSLDDLQPLQLLPRMTPSAAIALIRSARLYQEALWIAEAEPSLSWLLLVSSIEVAAVCWRSSEESSVERLITARPQLVELLRSTQIPNLVEQVAAEIAPSLGATKKFIDFLITFLPSAPISRPPIKEQISWEERNLKDIFSKIYGHRSHALHGGTPFPQPMCQTAFKREDWDAPYEKPYGLASSFLGGTWLVEDTPLLLHTFEYIARGALLKWWHSLVP